MTRDIISSPVDKCAQIADDFGIEMILLQNDIDPSRVVFILWELGLIDLEDYFYRDGNQIDVED